MRRPFHRSAAISLALCAMVLRALLPDGWMPSANAAAFVICSVDGGHKDAKQQPGREQTHAPCAFAAAAPLAPPAVAPVALAAPSCAARLAFAPAHIVFIVTPAYRPNAARAPPAFS